MSQILLITLLTIPLFGCITAIVKNRNFALKLVEGSLPIIFCANLLGLFQKSNSVEFACFHLDKPAFILLILLNFIWMMALFYLERFWQINQASRAGQLRIFLNFIVTFLIYIFVSKSVMVTLFFYSCLIFTTQFFAIRFLQHSEEKFLRLFGFLLYFESFFFFLAMVATHKFLGRFDFVKGGIIGDNLGLNEERLLLIFYMLGIFFSALLPYFLLFRKINFEPITTYIFFFFAYSFGSISILIKVINSIFGYDNFARIFAGGGFDVIEIISLFNIGIASGFLVFSRGIKLSFFYLFFQQFFFAIFAIFFFGIFDNNKIYLSLISFSLSLTLIFFSLSNLISYLGKFGEKNIGGLFYKLPISTILLIFAILSLAGLMPTIGASEKFFLIRKIWQEHLSISAVIILVNALSLLIFAGKISFYFFRREPTPTTEENLALARDIDFDSRLILTTLLTAIALLGGLFLF